MKPAPLKPCPFCGGRRLLVQNVGCAFAVTCSRARCAMNGPMVFYDDQRQTLGASGRKLEAKAVRLWNTRAA